MAKSKTVIWQPQVGDRVLTTPAAISDMTGLSRIERVTEVNPRRIITTSGRIFGLATLVSPIDEAYAEGCELRICKLTPELEARFAAFCVWQKQIIDLTDFSWADLKPEQLHHIHTQVMQWTQRPTVEGSTPVQFYQIVVPHPSIPEEALFLMKCLDGTYHYVLSEDLRVKIRPQVFDTLREYNHIV